MKPVKAAIITFVLATIVGFLAIGEALYLRYLAIEYPTVSLACQGGLNTWLCGAFRLVIVVIAAVVAVLWALKTIL